ncbi:bifunctional 2-C-methyl-D-erythritol 4-phosphate cytidylyltransferase/2-C-methyl-D-erythritol 2,4-cyclodiphosphate synthase [Nisaea acidiphila]|uniref:Bifunctional enzyme IspD/IspF n=1 Tax=Nisaea acidiphila TaxID=1862145 RepID=A0A9J7ASN7_9PROT|nr:bifunctional 2-C-methyl-D-erythritol 4-phosphate cytidylyltransferase/2-C-methyl-D-erythritol 2,4-cyclodiphosphate synthase [Nisaea acidiphila]UUX50190.1 bifunctional 2-C-methyl-D-erythritol 4-phosphate cytidylyltransferase/2-C-methyl-D-erythritol 2,4-cyclodiphosphate synthase [Nisaea acidiphila]
MPRSKTALLIVAAGRGTRLGSEIPKQYLKLAGVPVLRHALDRFRAHPEIGTIRVVIDPAHRALYEAAVAGLDLRPPVEGGAERGQSVMNGLRALVEDAPEQVLVHDAARPFVAGSVIDRVLAALDEAPGAIPALPVADTLKRAAALDGPVEGTEDRNRLFRAQTPQGFHFKTLLEAHEKTQKSTTDDAALLEELGLDVRLVEGDETLFKITTEDDLTRAEQMAGTEMEPRMGTGFDVHRLGPGESIMLCGIEIAHDRTLIGHSDADVGLHAITDALLGAIADGDIGSHFPPSDPQWKGAASDRFLAHARDLVLGRGGRITHIDVTLICERPKVGPHRPAMRTRIAEILGLSEGRVSVKATTSEKLGFTGRGEGIAAQAAATVLLPAEAP